jgi:hypothetical protein
MQNNARAHPVSHPAMYQGMTTLAICENCKVYPNAMHTLLWEDMEPPVDQVDFEEYEYDDYGDDFFSEEDSYYMY